MNDDRLQGEGDRFLIAEIRAGSADAFRRLVDRYSGRLKAFAGRHLYRTEHDPEDAVQETMLSLLKNVHRLAGVRSLQAYLFTILRRRIIDMTRGRRPGRIAGGAADRIDGTELAPGVQPVAPDGTPSTYARQNEAAGAREEVLGDVLESFLSGLKEKKRFRDLKVLELIFCCSHSHKVAADIAGTSEPTVSRIRAAAVEELRRLVARHRKADALEDLASPSGVDGMLSALWRENLFTCLKRSTLGAYALGALDADWLDYAEFHLQTIQCEICAAHLDDVQGGGELRLSDTRRARLLASSVGFLK